MKIELTFSKKLIEIVKVIILVFSVVLNLLNSAKAQYLHTSGIQILNGTGSPVVLRGVNLGNQFVLEGYALGLNNASSIQSHTQIMNAVVALVGAANANTFYQAWLTNYTTKADIDSIKTAGFNSVRVPFSYTMFYNIGTNTYLTSGFQYIDSIVKWCGQNQIYAILDMHCAPGSQNGDYHSDPVTTGAANLWSGYPGNAYVTPTVTIWKNIAAHYASDPWVGGYDLLNEPKGYTGGAGNPLRDIYTKITTAIRMVDNNHIIFAETDQSGWGYNDLSPMNWDSGNNLAISIHNYWTALPNTPQVANQFSFASSNNVPLWLGEFGENSNPWIRDQIIDIESRGGHWAFWNYKKLTSISACYVPVYSSGFQAIVDYWNGWAGAPSAGAAFTSLMAMATNTNIANAWRKKDVFDALTRTSFISANKKINTNTIPSTIEAVDYDMGDQGIAYNENDYYQQTTYNCGGSCTNGPWNQGWTYRNDGVDINASFSGGYHVGYISNGEWLEYTISVPQTGLWDITTNYSANGTGQNLDILLDNVLLGNYNLANTGGWENWANATNTYNLTAGNHVIKVLFKTGNVNLKYLKFLNTFPLPVTIVSFLGKTIGNTVALTWSTSSENNFDYFSVEKSIDGSNYQQIAIVKSSQLNGLIASYTFIDSLENSAAQSVVYYRLKIVDKDESYQYSSIINVELYPPETFLVELFPNPAYHNDNLYIKYYAGSSTTILISVIDLTGKIEFNRSVYVKKGLNEFPVNISVLSKGLHIVQIVSDNTTINKPLLIE